MIKLITQEYATSQQETREVPVSHAHKLGESGGFYKVQLVNEFGIIVAEYK